MRLAWLNDRQPAGVGSFVADGDSSAGSATPAGSDAPAASDTSDGSAGVSGSDPAMTVPGSVASIAAFDSLAIEIVAIAFMAVAGVNFAFYWRAMRGSDIWPQAAEVRLYAAILVGSIAVVTLSLALNDHPGGAWRNLRDSAFSVTSVMTSTGYTTVDFDSFNDYARAHLLLLMFIGGCAGSTAGGIKVTTLALLGLMVYAEVRGDTSVAAFGRRIPGVAQRQAFAIAAIALVAVVTGTLLLMATSPHPFGNALFEAVSAFGTVGLSTGITEDLAAAGKVVLIALMFLGRTGPYTLFIALALRERRRRFEYPEERPIIG